MTISLYFAPFTRATRPRWLLEELGVPYELVVVDLAAGEHKGEAFRRDVHPLGKVPALVIDGVTMFESTAIVAVIADRHLDKGFAPAIESSERPAYLQWLFYAMTTLEPEVVNAAAHKGDADALKRDQHQINDAAEPLSQALALRDWLLPSGFSAADIVAGSVLIWAASLKLVQQPALLAYVERCKARPAWRTSLK